jgi:hypothetical protein
MEIVLASSDEVYTTDKTWYKQLKQHICLSMIFMGQNRGNTVKIPLSFLFLSNTIIPTFKIVLPRYRWNTANVGFKDQSIKIVLCHVTTVIQTFHSSITITVQIHTCFRFFLAWNFWPEL